MDMSFTERAFLDCLTKNNDDESEGPSTAFQTYDRTAEQILNARTPEMVELLTETAKRYSTPGGYLLDITCGSGTESAVLINQGFKVVSGDLSDRMVQLAKKNKATLVAGGYKQFADWEILKADAAKAKEIISARPDLPQQYDIVFSTGSSLPFMISMDVIVGAFKNAEKLLRKGGALLVDHRNFLPAILNGKMNRNGFSPCIHNKDNTVRDVLAMITYGPWPENKPAVAYTEYHQANGDKVHIVQRVLTPETITEVAKATFGEDVKITTYYDLKSSDSMDIKEACWITYVIEKP